MTDSDDHALLAAYVAGSQEAFGILVQRHAGMVHAACRRGLGGDASQADDAVQAVFLVLANKAASIRHGQALAAWLHQAAGYVVIDMRRATQRRRRREAAAAGGTETTTPNDPWDEVRPHLDQAIATLREPQRQAVVLHYLEGHSQRAVAEMLGCSEDAVKKRLAYALGGLRAWFGRRGVAMSAPAFLIGIRQEGPIAVPPHVASGCQAAGSGNAAPAIAQTTQGALRLMAWARIKLVAGLLLATATLATLGVLAARPDPPAARWQPAGLPGSWALVGPAISPADGRRLLVISDTGGAYRSHDGGASWNLIPATVLHAAPGRPAFHPTEPDVVYAAATSPPWCRVSRDGGRTWQPTGDARPEQAAGPPTGGLAIDPYRPRRLVLALGGGLWRSDDAGVSWRRCDGPQGRLISLVAIAEPDRWFAATSTGIWRCDDGDDRWTSISAGLPVGGIQAFAGSGDRLYAAIAGTNVEGRYVGGLYRSDDAGAHWLPLAGRGLVLDAGPTDGWPQTPVTQIQELHAAGSTLWASTLGAGAAPPHRTTIWRSTDAGASWRAVFQADPRFPERNVAPDQDVAVSGQHVPAGLRLAVQPHDPDQALATDRLGRAYATTDGGGSWTPLHERPAAATGTWTSSGLATGSVWDYAIDPQRPTRHLIADTGHGCLVSDDAGASWRQAVAVGGATLPSTCNQLAIDPALPGRVWGAFSAVQDLVNANVLLNLYDVRRDGGVWTSDDGGATWRRPGDGLPAAPCAGVVIDPRSPSDARTLHAACFGHGVFRSDDGGASWRPAANGLGAEPRLCQLIRHADGTLFTVVTGDVRDGVSRRDGVGLYRSRDNGDSWQELTRGLRLSWARSVAVDPANPAVICLGAGDRDGDGTGGLWSSRDAGETWERLSRQRGTYGAAFHPQHPDWLYLTACEGGDAPGLWLSRDRGATWTPAPDVPHRDCMRVICTPDGIRLTTFGAGIWKGPAHW